MCFSDEEEEEEQVPADMGTSAEAMQVSLGEEEEGDAEENDENWLGSRGSDSPRPEGLLPAAKRPRMGTKSGSSPEWSFEPREPLSSLNAQHMTCSPSPPLPLEMVCPTVLTPSPGQKPKVSSLSPARQKNKSPKRVIVSTPSAISARPSSVTPPKSAQKAGKRSPGRPRSPRSPRPGLTQLGHGFLAPITNDVLQDGELKDEAIEDSIAAVIARACAGGVGVDDPFAYDSDSDSEGLPKSPPKHMPKHTLVQPKLMPFLGVKHPTMIPQTSFLAGPNRWTLDDSIDEVIRKANQGQAVPEPPEPSYFSTPSESPPTPPPPILNPPQERKDPVASSLLKKKLKKDLKTKLKKKDRERLKEKGKDKNKNKEKNKEKKKEKERGQGEDGKTLWTELSLEAEERRDGGVGKKEKDKHKDKKKDKEKSKKDKEKRDKFKERGGKEERRLSLAAKESTSASLSLFSPSSCLRVPSILPPLQPILHEAIFHPKETKSKEKDKKKEKKEKKKKKDKEKERDKDRERERPREKEEKKKEKEKKEKVKEKEKPKVEKASLMVRPWKHVKASNRAGPEVHTQSICLPLCKSQLITPTSVLTSISIYTNSCELLASTSLCTFSSQNDWYLF